MSCPDAAADGSSGGSSADSIPVTALTLNFTNDYKVEDNLTINFSQSTVSSSMGAFGVPQDDASFSKSGNTHNVILKVRPYYAFDDVTAGKVTVTPALASSASSSIPANNELAITNNVISFTGTLDGATHTYTITLERQEAKVSVTVLNVAINNIQIEATTNSVNHFVNMFIHDSATPVAYATALGYVGRTTGVLTHGETGKETKYWLSNIAKNAVGNFGDGGSSPHTSDMTKEASVQHPMVLQASTQYWLHVYYKDPHSNAEKKDLIIPFTTLALPTAAVSTATRTDYAHTWAKTNGYTLHHPYPAGPANAADSDDPTKYSTELKNAKIRYFDASTKNFTASTVSSKTSFDYQTITGYNFGSVRIHSAITLITSATDQKTLTTEMKRNSTSFGACNALGCTAGIRRYVKDLGSNKQLDIVVISNAASETDGAVIFSTRVINGSGVALNLYTVYVAENYLWVTNADGSAPIRPIK